MLKANDIYGVQKIDISENGSVSKTLQVGTIFCYIKQIAMYKLGSDTKQTCISNKTLYTFLESFS